MYRVSKTSSELRHRLPMFSAALARLSRILFDARTVGLAMQQGTRISSVPAPCHARTFDMPACMSLRCAFGDITVIIDLHSHPALASVSLSENAPFRAALATALLKQTFEKMSDIGYPALTVSSLTGLHEAGDAMDDAIASGLAIQFERGTDTETVVVTDVDTAVLDALEECKPPEVGPLPHLILALRLPGRVRIGSRLCSSKLLRSLRPGDVVLTWHSAEDVSDVTTFPAATVLWGSARGIQYTARARIDHTVITLETRPAMSTKPDIMNNQILTEHDTDAVDVAALELPVNLEIATMVLQVEQIAAMQPGHVMELPISIDDAQIRMVSYGQTLGYGQLVTVGDHLGFQISRMAKPNEPDA